MDDDEIAPVRQLANRDDSGDGAARHSSGDSDGSSWSSVSLKNPAVAAAVAAAAAAVSPEIPRRASDLPGPDSATDDKPFPLVPAHEAPVAKASRPTVSFTSSSKAPKLTFSIPSEFDEAAVPEKRQSGGRKGNRRRFKAPILVPVHDPNEHFAAAYGKAKREDELGSDEEGAGKARPADMASPCVVTSGLWKFNPVSMTYEMKEGGSTKWRPPGPVAHSSAAPKSYGATAKSAKSWAVAELGDLDEAMAKKSAPNVAVATLSLRSRVVKAVGFFFGETSPFFAPVSMEQLGSSVLLPQWAFLLWRVVFGLAVTGLWIHRVLQPGMSMFSITTSLLPAQSTVCLWMSMCGLWMGLLMEPDWYISTTFARPPPLFTFSVITLYASTGAFVVDLLLGAVPIHLPYTWMTMALTATYTLSVSVAVHGRDLPTPHRLGVEWSGVLVAVLSGVMSVVLFFVYRLLHVTVKSRLETARLLNQRSELEARIATAEAEAALSDMDRSVSPVAHGEDRLKRRNYAAALLGAMDARDSEDIFEEDD
ncbi:hypothetical protein MMPV_001756 [Pyropia vietnamensis]